MTLPLPSSGNPLPTAVETVAAAILESLPEPPTALYLFGSAVLGGLRPHSDLDFLAVVRGPLSDGERRRLVRRLLPLSGTAGGLRPVELTVVTLADLVPWRYPPVGHLVFGEWLRAELEKGQVAPPAADPDLTLVLASLLRGSRNLVGPPAPELLEPIPFADLRTAIAQSLPQWVETAGSDSRNVILALARMWTTLASGEIVPKDLAAARMQERAPLEQRATLDLARRAYLGEIEEDRAALEGAAEPFVRYAVGEIQALLEGSPGKPPLHRFPSLGQ